MSIRADVRTYLVAQSGVRELVKSRVYPLVLPQSADLPAITYQRAEGGHAHNLQSASGYANAAFQFDIFAASYEQADTIAEALRQELQGFRGTMGDSAVKSVVLEDETDDYLEPTEGSDKGTYVISVRYRILHTESIPTFS